MSSSLQSPMDNATNSESVNPISSLDPVRRENAVSEAKRLGPNASASAETLAPQRRFNTEHPYQTPQSTESSASEANHRWIANLERYPGRTLSVFIATLAVVAFGLAFYLTIPWFTESKVVGCNGSVFNCDSVLNSRYSNWVGLPVSGLATLTYATLLVALVLAQTGSLSKRDLMWSIVAFCCLSAGAAALWFVFLQVYVLKHLCQYCLAAHACGIILALTFLLVRPLGTKINTQMGILALVALAFLSVGQALGKEAPTFIIIEEPPTVPINSELNPPAGEDQTETPKFDDVFEAPDFSVRMPQKRGQSRLYQAALVSYLLPVVSSTSMLSVQEVGKQEPDQSNQASDSKPATDQAGDDDQAAESASEEQNKDETTEEKTKPKYRRIMEISGGRIKLDVSQWPAIGNQEADFVCVEMFDYNCQHCRQTHSAIKAAREKMGDKMAVILLPVPLNTNCNNQIVQTGPQFVESCLLTKLAISVWKVNPQKFDEFHEWMFEGFNAPSYQTALAQAEKMVGKDELAKVLDSPLPDAYIQKHVQIYSLIGKGNVPKLLFRTTSIEGMFQSPDLLIDILNRQGPLVPTEVPAAAKAETEKK